MLEIGSVIDGKYKILSEIGHGGMSVVYMAINEKANKPWAIKEVRRDGVLNFEAVRQGLIVETDLLKKLSHPHLPSIVDVIENQDTLLIVMDYIEGNALSKTLAEYGAQSQDKVIEWAKQLCDVLGYLHSREPSIIYRDMKPANVMLKPDGNVVLIDFGTAREYKQASVGDTICFGTPGYAAPEQFGGMGQTDARTDIYCLGATMYHLVTGYNPSQPPYEILPIRDINPGLSSGLEQIILKCTRTNPDERYQSTAELMYALEHYETIDHDHRKKQTKKLTAFIACIAASFLFAGFGAGIGATAQSKASDNYDNLIMDASKTSDYDTKIGLYEKAIEVPDKAGKADAYIGLIKAFKENDSLFSVDEENKMVSLLKNNRSALLKDQENYADICFEVGKLYWYYYDYGNGSDNQVTKMKSAVDWFSDAVTYSSEQYENLNMASVYRDIGIFYRDVSINTIEADDKGMYLPFYENLNTLTETVTDSDNEIVKLELYELTRSALQQYATKFKNDGISEKDLLKLYEIVSDGVESVETTTDKTEEKKNNTIGLLADTKTAITTAYQSKGGTE